MEINQHKTVGYSMYVVQEEISVECHEYEGKTYFTVMEGNTLKFQCDTEKEAEEKAVTLLPHLRNFDDGIKLEDLERVKRERDLPKHYQVI